MNIFYGVVEDRINDPLKLGRIRVRVVGIHTENKQDLPTTDLPWAMIMQPTISAANSGVGYSPTGILEGTWVMLVFRDEDHQSPIVIGTLPGIPTANTVTTNPATKNAVVTSDGAVLKDSSGAPVKSGGTSEEPPLNPDTTTPENPEVKKPSAMTLSPEGLAFLKKGEGLASTVKGGRKLGNDSTAPGTPLYAYLDTKGIPTIGWGNTFMPDGSRVTADSVISKADADKLLASSLESDYAKAARRLIKVPVTQEMFDASVSMIYNMGAGGFGGSKVLAALNSGDYATAAALIPSTKTNNGTLSSRRNKEKNLFLSGGIPQTDGTTKKVLANKEAAQESPPDATKNPVVLAPVSQPAPTNSVGAEPVQLSEPGFVDPNKVYPKFLNEPDTNRLARHEKIDGTIIIKKEAARATGVPTANGSNWDQPKIPYNATYPYNHMYHSESGHIQEFDDTEKNERIHTYHRAGTYTEIDANGTTVNRIVGDSYSIIERNGHVLIRGSCNITVEGDANIRVENNTTLESLGNLDIKVGGNIGVGAGGNIQMAAGGIISMDASAVHLNSGLGGGVKKASGGARGAPNLTTLSVNNRNDEIDRMYETPEDGDDTAFREKQIAKGNIDPDEVKTPAKEVEATKAVPKPPVEIKPTPSDAIMAEKEFTRSYKLTDNFTLGDLVGNKEIPEGVNAGLTAQETVRNMKELTVNALDPIKRAYPNMVITSSFRSEAKNKRVGGVATSDHVKGQAADIQFPGFSKKETYEAAIAIQKMLPAYHQVILEYQSNGNPWIHVAYRSEGNSNSILTMKDHKTHKRGAFALLE